MAKPESDTITDLMESEPECASSKDKIALIERSKSAEPSPRLRSETPDH